MTWSELNMLLKRLTDEQAVLKLLRGERRPKFRERIFSRYKVLRNKRELRQLAKGEL